MLIKEASSEMDIANIDVIRHVLAESIRRVLSILHIIGNLAIHALVKIKLADVSVLDLLNILC